MSRTATWTGPFDSWSEAAHAAGANSPDDAGSLFGLDSWLTRQQSFLAEVRRGEWRRSTIRLSRASALPLVLAGMAQGPLRVIDLGGGSGWVADACSLAGISWQDYLVIDRDEVSQAFGSPERRPVRYASLSGRWDLVVDESEEWDVLYANSSLQYSPSNSLLLEVTARSRPRFVLLDDVLTTPDDQDGFAVQLSSDRHEPVRFVSPAALEADLADAGYELTWALPFQQPGHTNSADTHDADIIPRLPQPLSILYRRLPVPTPTQVPRPKSATTNWPPTADQDSP